MANDYTPVLQSVTLPDATAESGKVVYYFKDAYAREQLETLVSYTKFLGVTTTELEDGDTDNSIIIDGESVIAETGNIVIYAPKEFIWNGKAWNEFGDLSGLVDRLGSFAYADEGTANYTPSGSVGATFTGTEGQISVSGTTDGSVSATFTGSEGNISASGTIDSQSITISGTTGTATYTPSGTNSAPDFTGTEGTISIEYTPSGSINATFTGTNTEVSTSGVPLGTIQIAEIVKSLTGNYTPTGTIGNTEITVTPATSSVNVVTSVGTLPTLNGDLLSVGVSANDQSLVFSIVSNPFTQGTLPTVSEVSVVTNVSAAFTSAPTFTGDTVLISATFSGLDTTFTGSYTASGSVSATFAGSSATLSTTYTPSGTVAAPEFTGTGTRLVGTVESASVNVSGTYTPSGSIEATFDGSNITATGTYTPSGTINAAFTGSASTITVSPVTE